MKSDKRKKINMSRLSLPYPYKGKKRQTAALEALLQNDRSHNLMRHLPKRFYPGKHKNEEWCE